MGKKIYEVYVNVDTNDADYVSDINEATQEDIDRLTPIAEAIKAKGKRHNWENDSDAEYIQENFYPNLTVEELEWFIDMFTPNTEYGFHTIESIEYYTIPNKTILL